MDIKKIVCAIVVLAVLSVISLVGCGSETKNRVDVAHRVILDVEEVVDAPMPLDVEEIVVKG